MFIYNFLLPIIIMGLGFVIIYTKNPIYALICLITIVAQLIFYLLTKQIEFLSILILLIYIGAISILFLFIIMMFNLEDLTQTYSSIEKIKYFFLFLIWQPIIHLIIMLKNKTYYILYLFWITTERENFWWIQHLEISYLNLLFYSYFNINFILCSFLLLCAMVNAVMLAIIS